MIKLICPLSWIILWFS